MKDFTIDGLRCRLDVMNEPLCLGNHRLGASPGDVEREHGGLQLGYKALQGIGRSASKTHDGLPVIANHHPVET